MSLFGNFSRVVIVGNQTRDIEPRTLPSGTVVADISIAVNDRVKKGDQWVDETSFIDCTVFGKPAEWIQKFGGKGKQLLVEGRLRQDKWVDKTSGQNRTKLKVVIDDVRFLERGAGGGGAGGGGRGASAGGRAPASDMPYDGDGGYEDGGQGGGYGAPPQSGAARGGAPASRGRGAAPAEVPYAQSWEQADTGGGETPF